MVKAPCRLSDLFEIWFVQYNPLFFFSAFCILTGVFFMSQGLKDVAWKQGEFLLLWIPFSGFLVPESRLELGVLLLASGFVVLVLAVSYNWSRCKAFGKGPEEWG